MKGLVIKSIEELSLEADQNIDTRRSYFSIVEDLAKNKYITGGKDQSGKILSEVIKIDT